MSKQITLLKEQIANMKKHVDEQSLLNQRDYKLEQTVDKLQLNEEFIEGLKNKINGLKAQVKFADCKLSSLHNFTYKEK